MSAINNPLEFERELVDLERKLDALKDQVAGGDEAARGEYASLESKVAKLRNDVYGKLTPYQRVQLSRHFDRPFTLDFIRLMFTDFVELHGDRLFGDDSAIVGGLAKLGNLSVMVIGHQRGRTTAERLERNFGMPQPEGYRKALRLFRLAEKFGIPVLTLIDTQGAFPGLEAEERGQAEAIARNLAELAELTVPIICTVIGEGGSGGALALGVGDRVLMLENACYSVITPEGCASILWHSDTETNPQSKAAHAAEMLQLTAKDLKRLGVIDQVVRNQWEEHIGITKERLELLKGVLQQELQALSKLNVSELVEARYKKFRVLGPLQIKIDGVVKRDGKRHYRDAGSC